MVPEPALYREGEHVIYRSEECVVVGVHERMDTAPYYDLQQVKDILALPMNPAVYFYIAEEDLRQMPEDVGKA